MKPTDWLRHVQQLFLVIAFLPMLSGKSFSDSSKSPPYLKSNKSFFKLHTNLPDVHERQKRNSDLDFIGTVVDYSSDEKQQILQKHLDLRGGVSPEAANMEYMYWDDDLATMGDQWSSACLWEHGQPDNISPYDSLGQNLWLGGGSLGSPPDPVPAIQAWYNEDQYYDYDTNACSGVCGHYTQVVWASSIYVGCGRAFCESVSDGQYTNAWIFTCNYAPAGNYNGVKPYISGSSCTQCESGIATCHTNQCRNCTQDGVECDCNVVCYNCATVTAGCSCQCQSGWYGSDCNTVCEDTHQYCGQNPGWPGPQYCDAHPAVPRGCPAMCGVCEAATGDEVCDDSTNAPTNPNTDAGSTNGVVVTDAPETAPATNAPETPAPATNAPETPAQTTSAAETPAPTTKIVTDPQVCDGIAQTCLNGGTFQQSSCTCQCTTEYQGDQCENSKEEARFGVLILIIGDISNHGSLAAQLLRLLANHLTKHCNDNIETCCNQPGRTPKTRDYSFVSKSDVTIGMGYPEEHESRSNAYWTMIVVTVPAQTDLCSNGTEGNDRRKRDTIVRLDRTRRETETGFYLPQDILLEVVEENLQNITSELSITIDSVERTAVEETGSSSVLATWAIILIAMLIVVILIVIVIVMIIILKGGKTYNNKVDKQGSSAAMNTIENNNEQDTGKVQF